MDRANCLSCGSLLDVSDAEPFSSCVCGACGAKFIIPLVLGNLQIYSLLRDFGCVSSHEGYDSTTGRDALIYLLKTELPDQPRWRKLLEDEVERFARFKRPNLYPLFGHGEAEGVFYYTAPLADGVFLDKYVNGPDRRPFKVDTVVEFALNLAKSMAEAHLEGWEHHDLCLENIHIDVGQQLRVHNFTAARMRYFYEWENQLESSVSPYFISPEKAEAKPEGPAGDVFSFGVLFYYLLTGQYPFQSDNDLVTIYSRTLGVAEPGTKAASPYHVLINPKAVQRKEPQPPRALRKKVPLEASDLVMTMLRPLPEERPDFAGIVAVLERLMVPAAAEPGHGVTDSISIPIMKNLSGADNFLGEGVRGRRKQWMRFG